VRISISSLCFAKFERTASASICLRCSDLLILCVCVRVRDVGSVLNRFYWARVIVVYQNELAFFRKLVDAMRQGIAVLHSERSVNSLQTFIQISIYTPT